MKRLLLSQRVRRLFGGRLISLRLSILLVATTMAVGNLLAQTAVQPAGSGTSGTPYQIATLNNLYWVTQNSSSWSSYFIQTQNIDASSTSTWDNDSGFTPIGNGTTQFGGTYDGGGHTISGLYISRSGTDYIGLFGYTVGATLDSVGVINEDIKGYGEVGGLVGMDYQSTVSDCYSTGSVGGSYWYVGGLAGYNYQSSSVNCCYSSASVSGSSSWVGGLVGQSYLSSTISNSYSTGSVTGNGSVGGLLGYNNSSSVENSYSTGSVTGNTSVGGLVGDNNGTVSSSFWNTDSTTTGIGAETTTGAAGETTTEMKTRSTFTDSAWDFSSVWNMDGITNSGYPFLSWQPSYEQKPSGGGTATDPYLIASLNNLAWLQDATNHAAWGSHFKQTADIDASTTSTWNADSGFSPIGNSPTYFLGTYDGGGHTISGLYISRGSTDYVGFFGYLFYATIDSLGLTDENIAGKDNVGGLAGSGNTCTESNSFSSGSISGNGEVGGLIGFAETDTVSYSYSSANVNGTAACVGGLVGDNDLSSMVRNSYTIGSVSGSSDYYGGLVGYNRSSSTTSNSYSTASVSGSGDYVGGLVGSNASTSTISYCYSTGSVSDGSGHIGVGGLVGDNSSSTVSRSFWDATTSNLDTSAGGTPESDAAMKTESTFTDSSWDFTSAWAISPSVNSGYPGLQWTHDYSLPVQANTFVATSSAGSVTLSWETQSEVNNAGFNILRQEISNDGQGMPDYQLVGSYRTDKDLAGLGTSSTGKAYRFTDTKVRSGADYKYKIQEVSTDGTTQDLTTLEVAVSIPTSYALYQNYPNPFNPTTTIRFDLKQQSTASLEIYNVLGQRMASWNYGMMDAGTYNKVVDMSKFASGVYLYRLKVVGNTDGEKFVAIKKLMLVK